MLEDLLGVVYFQLYGQYVYEPLREVNMIHQLPHSETDRRVTRVFVQ